MTFQISALPIAPFESLFALDDTALRARRASRVIADKSPGFPCRISLVDAAPGETLVLVHFEHQPEDTPFRASHAVYVREAARQAHPAIGAVPILLRSRTLSLRGFDASGMMQDAALADGSALESALGEMFAHANVAYIHLHYAGPGCYAARADRKYV